MTRIFLALAVLGSAAQTASAQLPQTRLYSLKPPGVPPGQISNLSINTGADLDDVDRLIINHPGIFATQKRQPNGQPVANTFRVAVEADVPPGRYEVRAVGRFGTSNPRMLIVDPRPTITEAEPNNDPAQAQAIEVGTLVDGQVNGAGDRDLVKFSARQGERVIIDCLAERIDSRLNPMLTLYNADARPIAFAQNEYGRDAFLMFDVPADGEYFVEVRDETFAGGSEHIYRLQIHRDPHIRFAMPPAELAGTTAKFTLYGYNLPGGTAVEGEGDLAPLEQLTVEITVPAEPAPVAGVPSIAAGLDLFPYRHVSEAGVSNEILLGVATSPVTPEQEPNDQAEAAQALTLPTEVTGQLTAATDIDRYTFTARKGQELWIEVIGQRTGAVLDPHLTLEQITVDGNGVSQVKSLTVQDDTGTNLAANVFDTATDDPAWKFTAPEDATFRLSLRNLATGTPHDPARVYRLIVRTPQPDFRLVAVPAGQPSGQAWPVAPRRGDHVAVDVLAFRSDGFAGQIDVRPLSLPPGINTRGTVIREQAPSGTLVFSASELAPLQAGDVQLVGSAQITTPAGTLTRQHPVRLGGAVWNRNGNTPAISQLRADFTSVVLAEEAPYELNRTFTEMSVHQGRQLLIPMQLLRRAFDEKLTLKFDGNPKAARIDAADVVFEKGTDEALCRLFVRPDAVVGDWALGATAEAQVPYSRNPLQAEVTRTKFAIAQQEAEIAKQDENAAAQRVSQQNAVVEQAAQALQQAQMAEQTATQSLTQARQALTVAQQANDAAVQQVATLTEAVKQLTIARDEAEKNATSVEDEAAKTTAEAARQALDARQAELTSAQQAQATTQQALTTAQSAVKPAEAALAAAKQTIANAAAAKTAADQKQAELEGLAKAAAEKAKASEAARAAAEKAANEATNAAKPKNIPFNQPMRPLRMTILPAPVGLTVKAAQGEIKAGQSVDVTVTIKRQNAFAGPVKLSLAVPEGVAGLTANEVEVAPEAETGTLTMTTTAEAAAGDVANLVVRATMQAGGEAIVDAPLAMKVSK